MAASLSLILPSFRSPDKAEPVCLGANASDFEPPPILEKDAGHALVEMHLFRGVSKCGIAERITLTKQLAAGEAP